jgi:hypothetical protein
MRKYTVPVLVIVCLTTLIGVAAAVRPSGPGQSTKANSLSVAIASDQTVAVSMAAAAVPQTAAVATASDAVDAGFPSCTAGIYTNSAGAVTAVPCGGDAGVQFLARTAGSLLSGCFSKILATGTDAATVVCQSF